MGHHAQQSFLGVNPIDQGFIFLAQHQQLIFKLQFLLRAASVQFSGAETQAQATHHSVLLPAGHPTFQLLENIAAGKDLLGCRGEFDQCWGDHQTMQLQQFRLLRWIRRLQSHLEADVIAFEVMNNRAKVLAGEMVPGSNKKEF